MNNDIAVCYLTHNHPDVINQILPIVMDIYASYGIDILVYDDSDDDKTLNIVNSFINEGHDNLYYVDAHCALNGNDKMLLLLKGFGLPKPYKYIWPSKDRCFIFGDSLKNIVDACKSDKYHLIFATSEEDRWEPIIPKIQDEYTDPVLFFSHYGQLTTNWEAMVYNYDKMLGNVNWDDIQSRTLIDSECCFNQTLTVFTRLSEIENPFIRVVHLIKSDRVYSSLASSNWYSAVFNLWINNWVTAISSLPPIYDPYKLSIVKAETMIPMLFGGTDGLLGHKVSGALTKETFDKYRPMWSLVSDYPMEYVDMIIEDKVMDLINIIFQNFLNYFAAHDYIKAYILFINNTSWLKEIYKDGDYEALTFCFNFLKRELSQHGSSQLFNGINTPEELIARYKSLINNTQ